jgi:hypothetical protein
MVEEFVWIILSPREPIHLHQASTWADLLIVVVEVVVVADVEILTMIEDTIKAMTDTKIMVTEEDHLLLIIVDTDHDQDLVPKAQDAIDNGMVAVQDVISLYFPFLSLFLILDFPKLLNPS